MRDRNIDTINSILKDSGTPAQRALLDSWTQSQNQARQLSQSIIQQLNSIADNGVASQMTAAALLVALKMAPAITVHMNFGDDNHTDNNTHLGTGALPSEEGFHGSSVAAIQSLMDKLAGLGLSEAATFATLTTFGRTNCNAAYLGRTHNSTHSCGLIMSTNVSGSVVGGATLTGNNFKAAAFDSATGASRADGDVQLGDTLGSYAATIGAAVGMTDDELVASLGMKQAVRSLLS